MEQIFRNTSENKNVPVLRMRINKSTFQFYITQRTTKPAATTSLLAARKTSTESLSSYSLFTGDNAAKR